MDLFAIPLKTIDGRDTTLAEYRGQVLLIVNVASRCAFTKQYTDLEALYQKFRDRGFVILGFPCNQFGDQEPGTESEIQQFCSTKYAVTFPLFAKIDVNGPQTHPLFQELKAAKRGFLFMRKIHWNFTKFLVNRGGIVVQRFSPWTQPSASEKSIEKLLRA